MLLTRKVLTEKCSIEGLVLKIKSSKDMAVRGQDYEIAAQIRDIEMTVSRSSPGEIRKVYGDILERLKTAEDWFFQRKKDKLV